MKIEITRMSGCAHLMIVDQPKPVSVRDPSVVAWFPIIPEPRYLPVTEFRTSLPLDLPRDPSDRDLWEYVQRRTRTPVPRKVVHRWLGNGPRQVLATVNRDGTAVVFHRARRAKLRRMILKDFNKRLAHERALVAPDVKRAQEMQRDHYEYLLAIRESIRLAYDEQSDTLFCSKPPHWREMRMIEATVRRKEKK